MIANHVTSLKTSKRLNELGFNKASQFRWQVYENGEIELIPWVAGSAIYPHAKERHKAYLYTELLEWLEEKENIISSSLIDINKFIDDKTSKCDSLAKIIIYILEELKQ